MPAKNTEPILLTINDLLQNPTGKSTAFMSARSRIIEDLENRYVSLLKKHKTFNYRTFKNGKDFIFLFEIPSETYDKVFYDVVIQFYPGEEGVEEDKTLSRYYLKLFSNSPNFTFTYAYVINQHDLIPDLFKSKCAEISLKDAPKVRNPVETYGFEKSCYFACLFIRENKLYNKFEILKNLFIWDKIKILVKVKTAEGKYAEVSKIKKELALQKKKDKQKKALANKNKVEQQRKSKKKK